MLWSSRYLVRSLGALAVAFLVCAPPAAALTVRDVIELSRAGLGEEVLLALVEVDGGVYAIDAATLKSLKEGGVPERVIVAMVRSGRQRQVEEPVAPTAAAEPRTPEPQIVVIDHREEPQVREVMVPVPIYVPVDVSRSRRYRGAAGGHDFIESTYVPFQSGPPPPRPQAPKREPVYWGFGGKLRPDAWQPDNARADSGKSDRSTGDGRNGSDAPKSGKR